jgi:hypothetical protein
MSAALDLEVIKAAMWLAVQAEKIVGRALAEEKLPPDVETLQAALRDFVRAYEAWARQWQ